LQTAASLAQQAQQAAAQAAQTAQLATAACAKYERNERAKGSAAAPSCGASAEGDVCADSPDNSDDEWV
jgi:hypothetical protein